MRQFTLHTSALNTLVRSSGIAAQKVQEGPQKLKYNEVIRELAVVYHTTLNGTSKIIRGHQSTHIESEIITSVLSLELVHNSQCDFIRLFKKKRRNL